MIWEQYTKDMVVSQRQCILHQAVIVSNGQGEATSTLYDGVNTAGRKLLTIKSVDKNMHSVRFADGIWCSEGLYLDIGDNVDGVLLGWMSVEDV